MFGSDDVDKLLGKLVFKAGMIKSCKVHPEADKLYIEEIDMGEESGPRTICSGLKEFVPLDQMQNRMVVVLTNLKPRAFAGVKSAGMVICASNDDHTQVELMNVPDGVEVGERFVFDGVENEPEEELKPKKKIWEKLAPGCVTTPDKKAAYKGQILMSTKGPVTAPTMAAAHIG